MQTDMKAFIGSRIDDFLSDLETLVNIDSSSDNLAGIEAVAEWLRRRLEKIGFTTRFGEVGGPGRALPAGRQPVYRTAFRHPVSGTHGHGFSYR